MWSGGAAGVARRRSTRRFWGAPCAAVATVMPLLLPQLRCRRDGAMSATPTSTRSPPEPRLRFLEVCSSSSLLGLVVILLDLWFHRSLMDGLICGAVVSWWWCSCGMSLSCVARVVEEKKKWTLSLPLYG